MSEYKSMVFYSSWYETASKHGSEFRNNIVDQLLRYGLYGELPDNSSDPVMEMMFEMAKPNIDANIKKKIDGAKGGRKPGGQPGNTNAKKRITTGLSNADANAYENADADAYVNEEGASVAAPLKASRPEPMEAVDVSKLKGRAKK